MAVISFEIPSAIKMGSMWYWKRHVDAGSHQTYRISSEPTLTALALSMYVNTGPDI